ncbi:19166_t:CDS:2 [Racocetra fulgida]|uniref:19166_t:CDS:1 n=1 Tax=Racocetra fulgida TaxID=60492 RepID=A0A9N9N8M3_9GLOM|nr:19166_t:CDS:2 [Racocetra fulgida]
MNTGSTGLIDQALLSDDIQEDLQTLLAGQNITDYHDQSGEEEYHSLMNGLLSYLGLEFMVISNQESGNGRYDHALIPRVEKSHDIAFIFEYKKAASKEDKELDLAAEKGLKQIDEFNYDIRIKEYSQVKRIIKIGLAFRGKKLKAEYKIEERRPDNNGKSNYGIKNPSDIYHQMPFLTIAEDLLKLVKEDKVEELIFLSTSDERKIEVFEETFRKVVDKTNNGHSDFDIFIDDSPQVCKGVLNEFISLGMCRNCRKKEKDICEHVKEKAIVCSPYYPVIENQHHKEVLLVRNEVGDLKKEHFSQ